MKINVCNNQKLFDDAQYLKWQNTCEFNALFNEECGK